MLRTLFMVAGGLLLALPCVGLLLALISLLPIHFGSPWETISWSVQFEWPATLVIIIIGVCLILIGLLLPGEK